MLIIAGWIDQYIVVTEENKLWLSVFIEWMSIDTQLAKVKHNTQNIKTDCYKTVLISETTFETLLISNYIEGQMKANVKARLTQKRKLRATWVKRSNVFERYVLWSALAVWLVLLSLFYALKLAECHSVWMEWIFMQAFM